MKFLLILLLVIAFSLVTNSCKKHNNGATSWSAIINGQKQSGNSIIVYTDSTKTLTATLSPSPGNSFLNITLTAVNGNGSNDVVAGIYQLDGSSGGPNEFCSGQYLSNTGWLQSTLGGNGQLNIKQISLSAKTISGTFDFVAYAVASPVPDSVVVTDGSFSGPIIAN